ncbi:hypothetical protein AYO21_03245 [Fonsecaea monophora]|uniref:DUF7703 domain-containing protein n=1 Tax=Fonsecaea monophora TaxID=254056 RepID=A0A177FGB7_9EURO|nr:hypothetical protein AYO21_03245 [Fonsecaea monophora]OAG42660.1 hypothetical protein AYO21_03245 [Fonsecaea monophora]
MSNSHYTGSLDTTTSIVAITSALCLYNALELVLLIFTTFANYRGLYFWSLLVATTGLVPYTIGLILNYFQVASLAGLIINNYGWWTAITGQSVVLYSRLGIVLGKGNDRILRYVKWMIIVDGLTLHTATTVVEFGSYYGSPPAQAPFSRAYTYVEKIQMTVFCIQEFIISALYLWKTMDIVKAQSLHAASPTNTSEQRKKRRVHRVMWQLFIINVVIIVLDIALLVLEYRNLHVPEVAFKGFCYSVKLKLEFAVLSKLVEVARFRNARPVPASLSHTFDVTSNDVTDSLPTTTKDNADMALDLGHGTGTTAISTSKHLGRLSRTDSASPPEWAADVLTPPRHIADDDDDDDVEMNAECPHQGQGQARRQSSAATFGGVLERGASSISTLVAGNVAEYPHQRRVRTGSEFLYADAIREIARRD